MSEKKPENKTLDSRFESSPETPNGVTVSGSGNVLSFNQQGGQTARTIINQAKPPEMRITQYYPVQNNPTGDSTLSEEIEVIAETLPNNMLVAVRGEGVTHLGVTMQRSGAESVVQGTSNDWFFQRVDNPWGRYRIYVTTTKVDVKPELRIQFNVK
jgi:hypothetical protein